MSHPSTSYAERFLPRGAAPARPAEPPAPNDRSEDDSQKSPYGRYKARGRATALEFCWLDQNWKARMYSTLVGAELDGGPDAAVLEFSGGLLVRLTGRNLLGLLQRITDERQASVDQIREEDDMDKDASAVYAIEWLRPQDRG